MKATGKTYWYGLLLIGLGIFASCSDSEIPNIPDHELDVEFRYELTCSDMLLKYVTPKVSFTDGTGELHSILVENDMWEGGEHKTWRQSVHYDSLNVASTATVSFVPRTDVEYQDETAFDNVHYLSCLILVKEDGEGRRNNYTIIPDYPTKVDVTADVLREYVNRLTQFTSTRGGIVDIKGEITNVEND